MTDPLAQLRADFLARCGADLRRLKALEPSDPEVRAIAHRLAGAAGSFGYPDLSEVAAQVDDGSRDGELTAEHLADLLDALRDLAA